jgi:hypothetical protein
MERKMCFLRSMRPQLIFDNFELTATKSDDASVNVVDVISLVSADIDFSVLDALDFSGLLDVIFEFDPVTDFYVFHFASPLFWGCFHLLNTRQDYASCPGVEKMKVFCALTLWFHPPKRSVFWPLLRG